MHREQVVARTGGTANPGVSQSETNAGYETLIQADGPIYFAGDHCSHIVGWQEGAALSSLRAIGMINEKVKAKRGVTGVCDRLRASTRKEI